MIDIRDAGNPLSEAEIFLFEQNIEYPLPKEYRDFMLRHNGGRPVPDGFLLQRGTGDDSQENAIHYFYGLGLSAPHADLYAVRTCFDRRIPIELLAIASDHFGNQICVGLCERHIGALFFWDHDFEHAPPTYRNILSLAPTFNEFVSKLHERKREWETPVDIAIRTDDLETLEGLVDDGAIELESVDQFNRSMIERAAIANSMRVFEWLYKKGASLGRSRELAEENAKFFAEHERMVQLIERLTRSRP